MVKLLRGAETYGTYIKLLTGTLFDLVLGIGY